MKNADMSIQTIAIVVLVLIVIFIVGFIFRQQILEFAGKIFEFGGTVPPDPSFCDDPENAKENPFCKKLAET